LGVLDPASVFGTLRGVTKETKFAGKSEHTIESFFVRKPSELPNGPAKHWAMFFKLEREGKQAEKWIKVDLIKDEYRVVYHSNIVVASDAVPGFDHWYSVEGLTVPELYQILSTVAKAKGRHRGDKVYNCQDFVIAMLEQLAGFNLQQQGQTDYLQK